MAQKVLLHIGRHKTGTSTLQYTLHHNRELLSELGYLYLSMGFHAAHHPVADAVKADDQAALSDYRTQLQTAAEESILLSSEAFQNCEPAKVAAFLDGFDTQPVCYLREQGSYVTSAYAQRVQRSTLTDSLDDFSQTFGANYAAFLRRWTDAFDRPVIVRRFERESLIGGDIVADFLQFSLQLSPDQQARFESVPSKNPTLSAPMLAFKLRLNREGYRLNQEAQVLLTLKDDQSQPKFVPPPEVLAMIRRKFEASNDVVADTYFGGEELFSIGDSHSKPTTSDLAISDAEFADRLAQLEDASPGCISGP